MIKKIYIILIAVALILTLFSGCVDRFVGEETDHSTGEVLTPEMIESIFNEISTPVTEKYPTETDSGGNLILYWLQNGTVWHISLSCGSVAKASPESLRSGDIGEAIKAGKERGCKVCAADIEIDIPDTTKYYDVTDETTQVKYPKEYDSSGNLVVYWVKNGSVWHYSRSCSSLSKSAEKDILSGSEADAMTSGKERACKICSEN